MRCTSLTEPLNGRSPLKCLLRTTQFSSAGSASHGLPHKIMKRKIKRRKIRWMICSFVPKRPSLLQFHRRCWCAGCGSLRRLSPAGFARWWRAISIKTIGRIIQNEQVLCGEQAVSKAGNAMMHLWCSGPRTWPEIRGNWFRRSQYSPD